MAKIEDFGEKIGGAKKDLYFKKNGLTTKDYNEMPDEEKNVYMDKKFILPKYNYDKLREKGMSGESIMYVKKMWESIPNMHKDYSALDKNAWAYIKVCETLKAKIDEYIENPDEQATKLAFNKPYTEAMKESGIWTDNNRWNDSPEAKSFKRCINKNFKPVTVRGTLAEMDKGPFYETAEEYVNRELLVLPIEEIDHDEAMNRARKREKFANRECEEIRVYNAILTTITCYTLPVDEEYKYVMYDRLTDEMKFYKEEKDALKEKEERRGLILKKLGDEETSKTKKSKKKFVYSIVENIDRTGKPITFGQDVSGEDYLETFKFRGGEFGNWLSDKERQMSLNSGYEAFMDLANALDIEPKDISLNGKLSIAFGARGSGNALAHYEPEKNVINLTKMKGAGSLAHEWGHALDYYLGKEYLGKAGVSLIEDCGRGTKDKFGMSDVRESLMFKFKKTDLDKTPDFNQEAEKFIYQFCYKMPNSPIYDILLKRKIKADLEEQKSDFKDYSQDIKLPRTTKYLKGYYNMSDLETLISNTSKDASKLCAIKESMMEVPYRYDKVPTEFFESAKNMDGTYAKTGHGYWQSGTELFARAFACYITDKLEEKGIVSPYLSGHSETCLSIPKGEERAAINKAIDSLIIKMKENGIFKEKEIEHTLITERHIKPEINMMGDIKVGEFMYIPNDEWKQKISDLCEYRDKQDACLEYLDEIGLTGETKNQLAELILKEEERER